MLVTVAVFVSASLLATTVTFRLIVLVVPGLRFPIGQVTVPDEPEGANMHSVGSVPAVGVMPVGRGSVTTTLVATLVATGNWGQSRF